MAQTLLGSHFSDVSDDIPKNLMAPLEILPSKTGVITARENGKYLHSFYNPLREAEQTADSAKKKVGGPSKTVLSAAFFGFGLGYAALQYAKKNPNDTLILVEPDARYFFTALSVCDWTELFSLRNFIVAVQTGADVVVSLIEKAGGFDHCAIVANPAHMQHAADYFSALSGQISRNKQKDKINNATKERFSKLWLRNVCRNLEKFSICDGVNRYENKSPENLPFLILAAGPSLQQILPHLKLLKNKCVVIAVDTALRACLRVGFEPDFILLADPQYYAYMHIAGLSSPSSILITESAAYPPVYRFPCREILVCSSLFPLGKYFEEKLGKKGELSSGGSVSTAAWDFARLCGAREIYCAGLDLGFPDFETHIRGSTFEEKIHSLSTRLSPAEKSGVSSLFGANMTYERNYAGSPILTDNRMKMFAWWFESKCTENPGIKSYSLSQKSLKIPGFEVCLIEDFMKKSDVILEKNEFMKGNFHCSPSHSQLSERKKIFAGVKNDLMQGFDSLYELCKKGVNIADKGISDNKKNPLKFLSELESIDNQIKNSAFKDIASLVFPTERKLNEIFAGSQLSDDEIFVNFQKSKIIYKQIIEGIKLYRSALCF